MVSESGLLFFILILISGNSLLIAYHSSRQKNVMGSVPFSVCMVTLSLWSLSDALTYFFRNDLLVLLFYILILITIIFIPVLWFWFVLDYTGKSEYVRWKYFIFILLVPLITLFIIATNGYHGFFVSVFYQNNGALFDISFQYGMWYYFHLIYCFFLYFAGLLILVWVYGISPEYHKTQISYVIFGVLMPFLGYILFISGIVPDVDLTAFFFLLTGITVYLGVFRVPAAEIIPYAYGRVFRSIIEGVIISDRNGIVVDINPAAESFIGVNSKDAGGKNICDLLPGVSPSMIPGFNSDSSNMYLEMDYSGKKKYFIAQSAPLEPLKVISGFVLLLRDITSEYESRQREKMSLVQIEKNLEQLAILNDHIRNPLSVIVGVSSFEENPTNKEILKQAEKIDGIVAELDNHYLKSEKVRSVLKRHYNMDLND